MLEQLKSYENKWVAIVEDERIVASGEDAREAKKKAETNGFREVTLFRVMPFSGGYAPVIA